MNEIKDYLSLNKILIIKVTILHFTSLILQFGSILLILESIQVFILMKPYIYITFLDFNKEQLLITVFISILLSTIVLFNSRKYIVDIILNFEIFILKKQSNLKRFPQINSLIERKKITRKTITENFTKETKYLSRAFDATISLILDSITVIIILIASFFFIHYIFHILIFVLAFLSIIFFIKKGKLIAGVFEKKIKIDFLYRTSLINELFIKEDENIFITKIEKYIDDKNSSLYNSLNYYKERLIMVNKTYLYIGVGFSIIVPLFIYFHNQILLVENEKILMVYFLLSFLLIKTISLIANFMKIEYFIKLLNRKYIIWKDT